MNKLNGEDRKPSAKIRNGQPDQVALITGGAGFIGTNVAKRLLTEGQRVLLLDNLSRPGVEKNLRWLRKNFGERVQIQVDSIWDRTAVERAVRQATRVYHFAAQVAVTTSVVDPTHDFETNLRGTFNILEAIRAHPNPPPLLFTSTNKVYGNLEDLSLVSDTTRYLPADRHVLTSGISECRPLDFHSPYGCSKGAADQYVLDYTRIYGLKTVVFRMSCIYGPHQFGTEDQGWVAHFLIRAIKGEPITIYGDGRQVRDVLFVEDLVEAMQRAFANLESTAGHAFNMGGGPGRTISLLELIDAIGEIHGTRPLVRFEDWRPGDQRYYVSDTSAFSRATGWSPQTTVHTGLSRLYEWLLQAQKESRETLTTVLESTL